MHFQCRDLSCIDLKAVGGHKQGGRRDRNGHQGLKEGEGGLIGVDLASKLAKRGRGPLPLGSNEVRLNILFSSLLGVGIFRILMINVKLV